MNEQIEKLENHVNLLRQAINKQDTSHAVLDQRVKAIEEDIKAITNASETRYVLRVAFEPVRNAVYGLVFLVFSALVTAAVLTLAGR